MRYDIRFDKTYMNAHNDAEWYQSDTTHVKRIIQASPNAYKETPTMGVNIETYRNAQAVESELRRSVMLNLQADQYECYNPIVTQDSSGNLTIDTNL